MLFKWRTATAALVCSFIITMPALGDQAMLEQALDKFNQGKYDKAARIWRKLAKQGDAQAQYSLAVIHHRGLGRSVNVKKAVAYYRQAAEQGHLNSMFNLGIAHWEGRGADEDPVQAAQWWDKAARLGFAPAQFNLGTAYYLGQGVGQDTAEALFWLQRASENGSEQAAQSLSMLKLKHPRLIVESEQAYRQHRRPVDRPQSVAATSGWSVQTTNEEAQGNAIPVYAARSPGLTPFNTIAAASLVDVVEDHGEWLRVRNRDQFTVWVYGQYINRDEGLGLITGGKVRLRPLPSTGPEAPAFDTLERGVQVEILETRGFWKKIIAPLSVRAWIRAADLGVAVSPRTRKAKKSVQKSTSIPVTTPSGAHTGDQGASAYAVYGGGGLGPFTHIAANTTLEIMDDRGEWLGVRSANRYEVWVHGKFLDVSAGEAVIRRRNVRIRPQSSTGPESPPLGHFPRGERVTIIGSRGDWKQVLAPASVMAWVRANEIEGR